MGKIRSIENRGAVIAWSPLQTDSDLLAVGTRVRFLRHLYIYIIIQVQLSRLRILLYSNIYKYI